MFKLDRLELSGFKSFVDPAVLDFAGGMTAIVGPNGCGKSNVCDAVCWVLGERSAKSLRGNTMEDVIFAGAESRRPLGMAEVTLTLLTHPSFERADEGRITIGRRLHRSGESQYMLNGKLARLKEIKDLLMDTGLGIRAYSVIEQGKIGMILSGKPQERRHLLEEAAGITRYKERRRVTEVKLEEARGNLERLDDIVSEIERSLRSLKRQAGAARRFQKRQRAHRELLAATLASRWRRFQTELAAVRSRLAAAVDEEAALTAELERTEAEHAGAREEQERLAAELGERHRREAELAARIEGKQEFLKGSRQRLEEVAERLAAGGAMADSRRQRTAELEEALAGLDRRHQTLTGERSEAASELSAEERRLDEVESLVADAGGRLESLRGRLLASIGDLNGLRNRLHREQVEQEKGELRQRHLAEELAAKIADLAQAAEQRNDAENRAAALAAELRARTSRRDEIDAALARLAEERQAAEERRDGAAAELAELRHRRAVLAELGEAQSERRQGLATALAAAGLARPRFLTDEITVPPGWEGSVDLFLGELADAVVLPPGADVLALVRALTGSAATGHLIEAGAPGAATDVDGDGVEAPLWRTLGLPRELAAALPPAYLVGSRADALALARRHPGVAFISRSRFWAGSGLRHFQGDRARPGALARRHELDRIDDRLPAGEGRLHEIDAELGTLLARRTELDDERRELAAEIAGVEKDLAVAEARREDTSGRYRRLSIEHQTVMTERQEIDRTLSLVAERSAGLAAELERSERLHQELEEAFDRSQKEVEEARSLRETARTTGASRKGHLELLSERLAAQRQERERLEREIQEGTAYLARWRHESETLERRREEIRAAMDAAERDLQEALERRAAASEEARRGGEELAAARRGVDDLEARLAALRGERDEVRQRRGELRVEEARIDGEAAHVQAQHWEEFGAGTELAEAPADGPPLDELEADLARLKGLLERTGPVNLLAAEEFDEQQQRYEFLARQRADVADSVRSLTATIRDIDATSSERFNRTFGEVNEAFARTFTQLFRGGEAEMRLLDESDPLETGIEIVARPPGKRLQNIMLMSGGEKALTAIALLFALFRTKPSPFCMLDEVDAPLDDVNTLRFVEMLSAMSHETQFIVITHNKLTMEAAARLYGVTMQERGVSRLVSVELDEVQPQAASA